MNIFYQLRKEKGLTQTELAKILNVKQNTISHWERDISVPDYPTLIRIADLYEVSTDELLGRETDFVGISPKTASTTERRLKIGDDALSPTEKKIIDCFRKLDVYQRQAFEIQIVALAEQTDKIKK